MKLIFSNSDGFKKVRNVRAIRFGLEEYQEQTGTAIINADTGRKIATQYEPAAWWVLGDYCFDNLRIED